MSIKIALAGNPNSGKSTLFNALTGSNQFVGNWPGVTVEKKEGKLKHHDNVTIVDLPGIYSLSPYSLEEVVARNFLLKERPDVILNIVDGSNLERNLYLTTQLTELGIPVVIALNMMDVVRKAGDEINVAELSRELGCKIVEMSALRGEGVKEAAEVAVAEAKTGHTIPMHKFSGTVEHALAHIEEATLHHLPEERQRWYAIKIFERDERVIESLNIDAETMRHIEENDINKVEEQMDDDAESIITNERYIYIAKLMNRFYNKKNAGKLTASDKIDRVVTNRFLALPIFAIIMFLVYYISVSTLGTVLTDWANDGLFGDGWHLFGIGNSAYEEDMDAYAEEHIFTPEAMRIVEAATAADVVGAEDVLGAMEDGSFGDFEEVYDAYADSLAEEGYDLAPIVEPALEAEDVPDTSEYGVWITGIPVILEQGLEAISSAEWLNSLILDGIIGGVGAVLGFVPQMIILFIILAFLEGCGYMARAAFVLDRVFRKFGLSGKSFIPMLIGTGCSVPGIMASRTIENERDRRMTIMTTSFIPCGAKLPIIAMIATALFNGEWWVTPSAYFVGITAVIISGIMLKKTNMFAGEPAPFVMEMPPYHWPRFSNVMRSMWERASSFIKRAGTIILLASIIIWAGSSFGTVDGQFMFSTELELEHSVLGMIGGAVAWIFSPLGFGNIKATVATVMGLVAKEEVVAVFGVLDFEGLTQLAAYSFLVFNLLCAPCFAAIGAIRREMNNRKWTWFAIGYQTLFAYAISLIVYQFGLAFTGQIQILGFVIAVLLLIFLLYMLFKPYKEATKFTKRAPNLS